MKRWIYFLIFLIFSSSVLASSMGITPTKMEVIHQGAMTYEGAFTVMSGEEKDIKIYVSDGPLAEFLTIEGEKEIYRHLQGGTRLNFQLQLPDYMKPGEYRNIIIAQKHVRPEDIIESGTFGTASAAIAFVIKVRVPNEGKHMEGHIEIEPANLKVGDIVYFRLPLLNFGTEQLENINTVLNIRDPSGAILAKKTTTTIETLVRGESKEARAFWESEGYGAGRYSVDTTLDYGGQIPLELSSVFNVGDIFIKIINVTTNVGETITKIIVDVESNWNEEIKQVYADIVVKANGEVIDTFKTSFIDLESWGKGTLEGFWESGNLAAGDYDIEIIVYYYDKEARKHVAVTIADEEPESTFNMNMTLIIVAIVLGLILLANMFLFYMNFKNKKK